MTATVTLWVFVSVEGWFTLMVTVSKNTKPSGERLETAGQRRVKEQAKKRHACSRPSGANTQQHICCEQSFNSQADRQSWGSPMADDRLTSNDERKKEPRES
jgi:hypothetical protein